MNATTTARVNAHLDANPVIACVYAGVLRYDASIGVETREADRMRRAIINELEFTTVLRFVDYADAWAAAPGLTMAAWFRGRLAEALVAEAA